ncbi:MFS transporter [Actinomadura sp. BRA 177]|uniref:MFS transporter n=1 Tax=Actinomadura sp. BRA 177 TaxID=2745202 RepID=UPI0015963BF2|nr:MFS transporter [Actinomadura sp. BRA 177]NVI90637.1 MFS transporter [Actinomadura sp. BRA 177]
MKTAGAVEAARARTAVLALSLAAFCFVTTESLPIGLLRLIADDLDVSPSAVGMLVTGYGIVIAVVSVPLVRMTARMGRRRLLTGVMLLFVVLSFASAAAPGYGSLMGARLVTALAQAVFWPVAAVAAAGLFPPELRGRAAAYVFAGGSLAIVLGVPLGTWLGRLAGWRLSFAALGALCLLSLVAVAVLLPGGDEGGAHAVPATCPDARRFRFLLATVMLAVGGVFACFTYIAEFLTGVSGFPGSAISPLLLVNGVADITGLVIAGIVVDRGPRALLGAAAGVLAAGMLVLFLFGTAAIPAVAGLVLLGLGLPAFVTAMQARALESAPGDTDVASAWTASAFNVGIAGGALLGGALLPVTGVRGTALAGGVLAAAAIMVILVDGPSRTRVRPPPAAASIEPPVKRFDADGTVRGQDH